MGRASGYQRTLDGLKRLKRRTVVIVIALILADCAAVAVAALYVAWQRLFGG